MFNRNTQLLLLGIFAVAIFLRFIYFPNNIYFGFDQARDAFAAGEILHGHIKLVGPPTSFEGLRHGVLYYYLYAPVYFISQGDPAWVAAFLRVVNATGLFLIFAITAMLFNKYVGFAAAFLYAISFEQTQFALYLNHPSLAVISVLIMFLGLALLVFRKKDYGFVIAFLGLGLSIQFEFLLTYLIIPFILILFIFRKSIPKIRNTVKLSGVLIFFLTISTFIITEIKFGFRSFSSLSQLLFSGSEKSLTNIINFYLFEMGQVIKFNLVGDSGLKILIAIILIVLLLILLKSIFRKQLVFLSVWFFSVIIIYFVGGGGDITSEVIQYHPNVGISLSLIIFVSYLLFLLGKRNIFLAIIVTILITAANFSLIQEINPYGSMPEINAQSGMLLSDEEKVIDYIYKESSGKPFAVKAITLPFYINTTWSYLFEWYGKKAYGYLPIWNGKNALGYPGNLPVEDAQDRAPNLRFLIVEPLRGIPTYLVDDYLKEESYFTDIDAQVKIGRFQVQTRHKK